MCNRSVEAIAQRAHRTKGQVCSISTAAKWVENFRHPSRSSAKWVRRQRIGGFFRPALRFPRRSLAWAKVTIVTRDSPMEENVLHLWACSDIVNDHVVRELNRSR